MSESQAYTFRRVFRALKSNLGQSKLGAFNIKSHNIDAPGFVVHSHLPHILQLALSRISQLARHVDNACQAHLAQAGELDQRAQLLKESVSLAKDEIKLGVQYSQELQHKVSSQVVDLETKVSLKISEIMLSLDERVTKVTELLAFIENISQASQMLSINASIEAVRAGHIGAGFSIIAQRMREMSDQTAEQSQRAAKFLDLREFREQLGQFQNDTNVGFQSSVKLIETTISQLEGVFANIHDRLNAVEEHNGVIFEFLKSNTSVAHALKKSNWLKDFADRLSHDVGNNSDRTSEGLAKSMDSMLMSSGIETKVRFDRLEDIMARGYIRVAVEPSFKGLSFRLPGGRELAGLDIEYAKAFGQWLGVQIEFIEHAWDRAPELLETGPADLMPVADIMWSALPPSPAYANMAFSESYTYLEYVLARKVGNTEINSLRDLEGKVLGCIKDPAAFSTLQDAGVRWSTNARLRGGQISLANLIAYSDQSRIHDCLVSGIVDAFAVDKPIYYWAANSPQSPWYKQIEILPGNIAQRLWHYAVGVTAHSSNYQLLTKINEFNAWFRTQPEREKIERTWQGRTQVGNLSYRDEGAGIKGADGIRP